MKKLNQLKFDVRSIEERGFVKFYITHPKMNKRLKKHVGKGTLIEFTQYHSDFCNAIEHYFKSEVVSFEAVYNFANDYIERMKLRESIFFYQEDFLEKKRKTFNKKTEKPLSSSAINCYKKSIEYFGDFLRKRLLSEAPQNINEEILNEFFESLAKLSRNYRVKIHTRLKEYLTYCYIKDVPIHKNYVLSRFNEQYDNQQTKDNDRSLTADDMAKLLLLRNEFKLGNFNLPPYKTAKTIPEKLQIKQRLTKEANLKRSLDCFLFMCCTGLYVADIHKKDLDIDLSTRCSFINYRRAKNNSYCKGIPLLDVGCFIGKTLQKEYSIEDGSNFPLNLSLYHFDKNLTIISELAKLDFRITSKMARKTFASIYHFDYYVDIEDIQFMLGHKEIRHTNHYLRIADKELAERIQKNLRKTA